MPPVVAFLTTIGGLFALTGTAAAVAGAAIIIGTVVIAKALMPKIDMGVVDTDRSRQTTVRSTIEPRKLVYGETMISGVVSFAQVDGANNKNLHQVIAIAGHKLTSIDKIYFDDYSINLSSQVDGSGDVTSGTFAKKTNEDGTLETMVHIETRDGSSTQTAYSGLVTAFAGTGAAAGTGYESTHRGDNVASIYTRWTIHEGTTETWDEVGGIQNIKAVVKGKAVYDPRLDVTAGNAAGANPTTAAYIKYSDGATTATHQRDLQGQNLALILADYLMDDKFGLGLPATKIDWPAVVAAADACDFLVPIPVSQTQKRFFGSGVIFGSDNHRKSISKILSGMNGDLIYSQGKYIIKAGVHETSSLAITEDDLAGDFTVKTSIPRADRFNTIKGMFIDPASNYKMTEFAPRTVSGAVARDNEVLEEEIKLTFTSDRYAAQRIAIKKVHQSFLQTTLSLPVNLKGMKVAVGDRITLALNDFATISPDWNPSKEFKVIGWSFSESGSGAIDLSLVEDDADRYVDPAEGDYNQISNTGVITSSLAPVPSPKDFTATAGYNSVDLSWTNPTDTGTWEQIWIFASDTTTPPSTPIEKFRGTSFTHQIAGGTAKYYWIQAVKYPLGATPASGSTNTAKSALVPFGSPTAVTALKIANAVMATDSIDTAQIITDAVGSEQIAQTLQSSNWSVPNETGWQINKNGDTTFNNTVVRGNISATTGTVGGFTIGSTNLIAGDEATRVSLSTADGISLGDNTFADAPFSVTPAGALTATNATITGAITATSLTLSGITIPKTDLATGVQTSLGSADSAIQDADTSVNLGLNAGSVGGITINSASLTSGSHTTYGSTAQGFFLGSNGSMSFADGTNQTLTIDTSGNLAVTGTVNATAGAFTGDVSTDSKFIAGANSSTVTLDGRASANYSIFAGDDEESNASFKVSSSGVVEATRLIIRDDANGQILIDTSNTSNPFSGVVYTSISQGSGAGVDTVSGHLDNDADEITITTTQAETFLITTKVAIDDNNAELNNIGGASTSSISDAISQLTASQLRVEYYLQEDGGSYAEEDVETISFTTSTPSSSQIKVLGLDRGAGYGGSLTRYHAIVLGYGAAELATYYNTAAGANRARTYAVTTASISISQAGTHKIKVLAKLVLSGTSTVISTATTPPLTNNQSTGVVLDPDQIPLNQSSLEDFRRLYEMTSANGFVASQTDDTFAIGQGTTILTSGGTISGDLVITGDLTVNGTTTSIHVADLTVADKDITLNYSTGDSSSTANDAGIIIQDAVDASTDASILWKTATDTFEFSHGVTWPSGSSANANTAYTYSQVGHLPLAGGTLTGLLTVGYTGDLQIQLTSPSSWTGIGFNDSAAMANDYIWHNGTHGTFAIGGDGANVANKKLHVDGGMTIGSGYDATAVTANSLNVEGTISSGAITSTGLTVNGDLVLGDDLNKIKFTGVANAMYLRMNGSDQMSFYSNDNATEVVSFGNGGGLRLQAGDASINTGVLKMGVTTFVDASRNITAGTISSGAITSTGNSSHGGYSSWTAGDGTGGIFMHYNATNSYRGYFDWRTLQLGNNGANNILAGNTGAGGWFDFWVNATAISQAGGTSGIKALTLASNGDMSLYESTGTTPKFFWDASAESLGIGNSSPTRPLQIELAEDAAGTFQTNFDIKRGWTSGVSTDRYTGMSFSDYNSINAGIYANRNSSHANFESDLCFYTNSGSSNVDPSVSLTKKMSIMANGNVGIGISPAHKLSIFGTGVGNATVQIEGEGGADPYINFLTNNTQHWSLGVDDSDADKFKLSKHSALGTNDYFVVDVTGNVLVGKTASDLGVTAGIELNGQYDVGYFTRSAEKALVVNRLVSDGTLAEFRKDGTTVGSVGVTGTNDLVMYSTTASHTGLRLGEGYYLPTDNAGATSDGTVDIGIASIRYKDLHLSGAITASNLTLTDDGVTGVPLLRISADDAGPWALQLYREDLSGGPQMYASDASTFSLSGNLDLRASFSLTMNGSTVIDSSKNISVGTISSGAITSTGDSTFSGKITVNTTDSLFYNRMFIKNGTHGLYMGQWDGSNHRIEADANRPLTIQAYNSGGITLGISGNPKLVVTSAGATVTGTISSGAITSSGVVTANDYIDLNDSGNRGKIGYDSNNVFIGSTSSTGSIIFKNNITTTNPPQTGGDTLLTLADGGNATFAGTISSGAINTTGNIAIDNSASYASFTLSGAQANGVSYALQNAIPGVANGGFSIRRAGSVNTLAFDTSDNATFAGTISSGAITPSGYFDMSAAGSYFKGNSAHGYRFNNQADTLNLVTIFDNGNVRLHQGSLQIGTTEVISASRKFYFETELHGSSKKILETGDSYLRINQGSAFSSGIWMGQSSLMTSSGYIAAGSNGGTTNARVYIKSGAYDGTNVIAIDGTDGKIQGSYYRVGSTTVIDSSRNITGTTIEATTKLYLNGGSYTGTIRFGSVDYWACGISQRDAGNAEMRIWAKGGGSGSIYFATNYDGELATTALPTDGMALKANKLGIGGFTASEFPSEKLHVKGNILATGNITAYSDERLKENIKTLDGKKVLQMRGVSFTKDGESGSGVIAQELEKVAPELVHDGEYKSVAYGNLVGYLIENAKQQQSEIDELKTLVKKLMEK